MGYFDLPRGQFDLLLKKKGRGRHSSKWECVMMTDSLYPEEIASCVEEWSQNYTVEGARYNGKSVIIPTKYHWELRTKDEVLNHYSTREEAVKARDERRTFNWGKPDESRIPVGTIYFVKEEN